MREGQDTTHQNAKMGVGKSRSWGLGLGLGYSLVITM